tara:strand:- start:278 stop:478 length:201 start_codon:yes stop_codon:yes gene_type:complete
MQAMPDVKKVASKTMRDAKLSPKQRAQMEKHAEHHSPEHINMMIELMLNGASFEEAHEAAQEAVGE